jgi:D-3-phosphoglycerate dehydrogenase
MLRIAILDDYQSVARAMADWSRIGPDVEIVSFDRHLSEAEAADQLATFDVLCIMRERMALPRSLIEALPRLKLIAVTGSHTQVIDVEAAQERGIPVTLTAPRASNSAAELTWAMVLGLARQITVEDRNMREGRWQTSVGFRLEGRTLGLIGLGTLGARVARYGQAFDMRVVAWSANLDPQRARDLSVEPVTKEELLRQSDVVSIHLKLGDRSRGLIGAQELALMKRSAVLVNTSRAAIIDQDALAHALHNGVIAGAALDVFEPEPLPADHPARSLPNTILTPHIGFVTEESYREFFVRVVDSIIEWRQTNGHAPETKRDEGETP